MSVWSPWNGLDGTPNWVRYAAAKLLGLNRCRQSRSVPKPSAARLPLPTTRSRKMPRAAGHRAARARRAPEGDLGQAWVRFAVPGKPVSQHHDPLQLTIPLARQQGARPQFGSGSLEGSHKPVGLVRSARPDPVKQTPSVSIEVAEPIGLQPISQNPKQQVPGDVRRCSPPEHRAPSGSEPLDVETAQTRDLVVR